MAWTGEEDSGTKLSFVWLLLMEGSGMGSVDFCLGFGSKFEF